MASEGGVFLDIFTRLSGASVDKLLKDIRSAMEKAGTEGGDTFTTSLGRTITASSKEMFDPLVEASNAAYREMQIGLADLQVAEARINDLRVRNFKSTTDQMIAAQRQLDEAIANSQRLSTEAATRSAAAREAAVVPPPRSEPTGGRRSPVIPIPRGVGPAAIGGALFLGYGIDQNVQVQRNTQQVYARGNENPSDIGRATNWIWQNSGRLGTSPNDLSSAYNQTERLGYRGQDAINMVNTAAEVAKRSGASIDETVKGLDTTLQDLGFSTSQHKANLEQINSTASQLTQTLDRMKISGDQATEFFAALHSIEPVLMAIQNGVPGNTTQAQGDAILQVLSQHGITPEQGAQNAGHFAMQLAGMRPDSPQYQALAQLGLKPQDIANQVGSQGITEALNTIRNQMDAKSFIGPDGQKMIHTGMEFNNDQLYDISKQIYGTLSPGGKKFVDEDSGVQAGVASGAYLRKELEKQKDPLNLSPDDVQNILAYSHDRALLTGLNPKVKKGGYADMTYEEYTNWLFGSGDTARTGGILLNNMPDVNNAVRVNSQAGPDNYLGNSFDKFMQGMPQQFQEFENAMKGLAGAASEKLIPAMTRVAEALNGALSWLDQHKAAEQALTDAILALVAAWSAAKLINLGSGLIDGLSFAADKARALGQLMSDRLPTQITKAGTEIESGAATLRDEEAAAGAGMKTKMDTAAATAATTIETGATTTAAEMEGSGIGSALKGAAATVASFFTPAVLAGILAEQLFANTDWDQLRQSNDANGGPGMSRFGGKNAFGGAGQPLPFDRPDRKPTSSQSGLNPNNDARDYGSIPGHAWGGIVPFHYDIGGVTGQPLMGVPDAGGDSVLGMLPNGQPVGLRGGEGILTPDTVAMLGGEDGVNALNAKAKNPWSDPFKVGTTFYNSFAKGVAKYSPWGKYLTAAGQSLDSLEKEHEQADKIQRKETNDITDYMIGFFDDKYAAMGERYTGPSTKELMEHPDKYWYQPGYGYRSTRSAIKGGSPEVMDAIRNAAASMGLNQTQYDDVKWIFSHESGFDPTISNGGGHGAPSNNKAYGLGQFLGHMGDKYGAMGAYSGDPGQETRAAIQYMIDRYGSPAKAKAFWESHGSYAHGGVVGYAGGGVIPLSPNGGSSQIGPFPVPKPVADAGNAQKYPPASGGPSTGGAGNADKYPPPGGTNYYDNSPASSRKPPREKKPPKPLHDGPQKNVYGNIPNAYQIPGGTQPQGDRNIMDNPSQQLTAEGKGFSLGGGLLGAAEGAAATAANAFAPGAGQAAQPLFDLANRAIGFGGQLVGIGLTGLMETFLPNDSPGADPSKNIFGKMALGLAGAHPSGNNMAGSHAKQLDPKKDLDKGAMQAKQQPGIHVTTGDIHNHTGDHSETFNAIGKAVNFANHAGTFAGQ